MPDVYRFGPSGGVGGQVFTDDPKIPSASRVIEVQIWAGSTIEGIRMIHETADGAKRELDWHGGGCGQPRVFTLRSNEYITGISGRCGSLVDSLRIHTQTRQSPEYGRSGGQEYHYQAPPDTEIVGFYGRSSSIVEAIGVILRRR